MREVWLSHAMRLEESLMLALWTGRVIGHTEREQEDDPNHKPFWMQGQPTQRDRRDPGTRGPYRKGMR